MTTTLNPKKLQGEKNEINFSEKNVVRSLNFFGHQIGGNLERHAKQKFLF